MLINDEKSCTCLVRVKEILESSDEDRAVGALGARGADRPPVFSEFCLFHLQKRDLQGQF